jgi:hypothetical protein
MWATKELIPCEPQPFEGDEVHEVEAIAPIYEGLGEPSRLDQRVNSEGKPPRLGDTVQVIHPIESDWRLGLAKVLQCSWAYGVDRPACKLELTSGLMESRPTVDRHDRLFFREWRGGLSH